MNVQLTLAIIGGVAFVVIAGVIVAAFAIGAARDLGARKRARQAAKGQR